MYNFSDCSSDIISLNILPLLHDAGQNTELQKPLSDHYVCTSVPLAGPQSSWLPIDAVTYVDLLRNVTYSFAAQTGSYVSFKTMLFVRV